MGVTESFLSLELGNRWAFSRNRLPTGYHCLSGLQPGSPAEYPVGRACQVPAKQGMGQPDFARILKVDLSTLGGGIGENGGRQANTSLG